VRLKKRAEFVAVAKGRRVNSHALTLQAVQRAAADQSLSGDQSFGVDRSLKAAAGPRFGLTVTNRAGNSPERNRMRRRLREALRLSQLPAKDSFDYVIVARRAVLSMSFADLSLEIARSIRRLHEPRRAAEPSKQTRQAEIP
jgi:ribonuclease P protein component